MIHRFAFPTTIHFGAGARALVVEHLKAQGIKRPLIVTDRGIAPLPMLKSFIADLPGLDVGVFSDIWGNPVRSQVDQGVAAYKSHRADAVIVSDEFFQPLAVLHHLLGLFRLVPEVRLADLLFDFG